MTDGVRLFLPFFHLLILFFGTAHSSGLFLSFFYNLYVKSFWSFIGAFLHIHCEKPFSILFFISPLFSSDSGTMISASTDRHSTWRFWLTKEISEWSDFGSDSVRSGNCPWTDWLPRMISIFKPAISPAALMICSNSFLFNNLLTPALTLNSIQCQNCAAPMTFLAKRRRASRGQVETFVR